MLHYFLPEAHDLVDANYDFVTDTCGPLRRGPQDDVYAHEIFGYPNCNGMLVSRSFLNAQNIAEAKKVGGIHEYIRFSKEYPIMGDCGAFQYIAAEKPPYTCEEICDYYEQLGFDYGISLDHVITQYNVEYDQESSIVPLEPTKDMKYRYDLTLENAEKILSLVRQRHSSFVPIGSAQGWSPRTYAESVEELAKMGYQYVAIGGVAKASDDTINGILPLIAPIVKQYNLKVHILGVARSSLYGSYAQYGVTSCDSAAPMLQAFKSSTNNYYTPNGTYTAVRIPPVMGNTSPIIGKRLKKILAECGQDAAEQETQRLFSLEQAALQAIRAYGRRELPLAETMQTLLQYDREFETTKTHQKLYEQTLRDRPWEKCECPICQTLGIEVILLRGNNRNRRRGFHNTYVFFKQFKNLTSKN